jgi:hypothetical protein
MLEKDSTAWQNACASFNAARLSVVTFYEGRAFAQAAACPASVASLTSTRRPFFTS